MNAPCYTWYIKFNVGQQMFRLLGNQGFLKSRYKMNLRESSNKKHKSFL